DLTAQISGVCGFISVQRCFRLPQALRGSIGITLVEEEPGTDNTESWSCTQSRVGQRFTPDRYGLKLTAGDHSRSNTRDQFRGLLVCAGRKRMADGLVQQAFPLQPDARAPMYERGVGDARAEDLALAHGVGEEMVIAIPAAFVVQGDQEHVVA